MIKNILTGVLLLFIFWSCGSSSTMDAPKLSEEKMVTVLMDIHYMEGALQSMQKEEKDSLAEIYYYHIFKKHNISEDDFYDSFDYYTQDPKTLENIYDSTTLKLNALQIN